MAADTRSRRRKAQRTDPHRPGAIVPSEYDYVFSYNRATTCEGWPVPSYGVNCQLDRRVTDPKTGALIHNGEHDPDGRCCVVGLLGVARDSIVGSLGQCTVCGTSYVYGDVWYHRPSGEYIHIGHTCSDKYQLLADRTDFEMRAGRAREGAVRAAIAASRAEERAAYLAEHPGLAEALATDHHIVRDIAERFREYGQLSDKQVALVLKIAHDVANPPPEDKHVPAPRPDGRLTFQGRVLSLKSYESQYGTQMKLCVRVEAEGGCWLAWGTCPASILSEAAGRVRGALVEITAALLPGREEHFALLKRPAGRVLEQGPVSS